MRPVDVRARPYHVVFVCWGNICRSPMAERIAESRAADAGLTDVRFTSAATSTDEIGNPIDSRAVTVLSRHGYRTAGHRAHQVTPAEIRAADLVVGMEQIHIDIMSHLVPGADNLALLTDFDPAARRGSGVSDPYYGGMAGFDRTLAQLERAMPGLLEHIRTQLGSDKAEHRDGSSVLPSQTANPGAEA